MDAEDLCSELYPSLGEALQVARRLRAAGWVVVEHERHPPAPPTEVRMVASVYHPHTYESPGDLRVTIPNAARAAGGAPGAAGRTALPRERGDSQRLGPA